MYDAQKKTVEEIIIQGMPLGAMKNFPYRVIEKEIKKRRYNFIID